MLYIGNHTSSSKGYTAMARQMISNGGNTFAFFTRNPRGGKAKAINEKDIQELWKRIVFSMAVSNTDDHFRNHGFILEEKGWVLSPMYDVNPDIYGEFLSLNVDEDNSAIDFDLAIEAAPYYEISTEQAKKNVTAIRKTVADNWRSLAGKYGISRGEIERMCPAFQGDV